MFEAISRLDLNLLLVVNQRFDPGLLGPVLRFITNVSNWIPVFLLLGIYLAWWGRTEGRLLSSLFRLRRGANGRFVLLAVVLAVSLSDFASSAIKHAVGRQRPGRDPEVSELIEVRHTVHGNRSFPSSHAANSAALATVLALSLSAPAGWIAVGISFLVGYSRAYVGVHYPFDVLAGWVLGAGNGLLFWALLRRRIRGPEMLEVTAPFRHGSRPSREIPGDGWRRLPVSSVDGCGFDAFLLDGTGPGLAVIVHGLGATCFMASPVAAFFQRLGCSVLGLPLRGHPWHPASRFSGGAEETYDLIAALEAAWKEGLEPDSTVVYGYSLGASIALRAAGLAGPLCRGLIAHAPPVSFVGAARRRIGDVRSRLLMASIPVRARRELAGLEPASYAPLAGLSCRVAYLAGERDRLVPLEELSELAACCPCAGLVIMAGAGHPAWRYGREPDAQQRCALSECLRIIDSGGIERPVLVDASGEVSDVSRSWTLAAEETDESL
ncbi:alpha/beta fold hydrolase [Candidatus Fermentibacterales bacterium]|nr:alpha/beta fold hydrolase [Candidatus Fermentibacterales bacterium]